MEDKSSSTANASRELVRHMVATLAYRGGKALRGAPDGFAQFHAGETTRTPGQILAHIGDLLDWGLSLAKGAQKWQNSDPLPWDKGSERFSRPYRPWTNTWLRTRLLAALPRSSFRLRWRTR